VKDINILDEHENDCDVSDFDFDEAYMSTMVHNLGELKDKATHKYLNDAQLKSVVDYVAHLDSRLNLYDLENQTLDDEFISGEVAKLNETKRKHLKQISSIVSQVDLVLQDLTAQSSGPSSCCVVELGAGRGKLSYWFDQSRRNKTGEKPLSTKILLIERGCQKHKVDTVVKHNGVSEIERIRIDLKDLLINKCAMIENSDNFVMIGKHLCGVATDFSLRCLKKSLEESETSANTLGIKFKSILLAVCCHHKCEWESLCGTKFLEKLGIDSKLFGVIRSMSSWSTSGGDKNITPAPGKQAILTHLTPLQFFLSINKILKFYFF
jgi:tRNA:m4X modification enzyme